jgi:hypothetical protein
LAFLPKNSCLKNLVIKSCKNEQKGGTKKHSQK